MTKKAISLTICVVIGVTISIAGCVWLLAVLLREPSEADVVGTYHRFSLGVDETLTLSRPSSFEQVLIYPNGKKWFATGTWELIHNAVDFAHYNCYWDHDKMTLVTPPEPVGNITFAVESESLTREMQ